MGGAFAARDTRCALNAISTNSAITRTRPPEQLLRIRRLLRFRRAGRRRRSGSRGSGRLRRLFEGQICTAERGLLGPRTDYHGLHGVTARRELGQRKADAERSGMGFLSTAGKGASAWRLHLQAIAEKDQAAREAHGDRMVFFAFFWIVGLEENVERLLPGEEPRHAGNDPLALHLKR